MKPLALLAALALCAGVALWKSIDDTGMPASSAPTDPATPRATRFVAPPVVVPPVPSTAIITAAPSPVLEAPPSSDVEREREAAAAVAERRERLQSVFASQAVDASWASGATRQLSDDFGAHLTSDARLTGVECRTTLCRAEITAATPEGGQAAVQTWIRHRAWKGRGFSVGDGDRVVVYVARPDHDEAFAN